MKHVGTDRKLHDIVLLDSQRLRSIAHRAGREERDDVVQDALVKVVVASRSEEIANPDHFLARVIRTVAIDRLRARKRQRQEPLSQPNEALVDQASDPERHLLGVQRLRRAVAIIDAMPVRRREVFLLHRVEDLTYPQIAKRLGISTKAVEKHIHLALKELIEADD
ncbi:MAG: RNA polymerase sigma factor [Proteobacteria bacterium]|nr:MAG: RNA polymerase sigma factor [Pseudomonadota bacterium]